MALASGDRVGTYEVVSPLGQGGMGEVYRARDTKLNRDVAIKVLPDLFAADRDRVARFEREPQLLASLNHPNIAAIYGLETAGESSVLVLELVEGISLAERLKPAGAKQASPLPVAEALAIARQIVDALEAAHEKGIVHRDLKPANVMVTADGQVKVLDFGLARQDAGDPGRSGESARPGWAGDVTHSPTLSFAATQAGMILGTAAYMSPEQAKGRVADKRSDVWAFGSVLFEMLTGKRAFDGEDISETLASVIKSDVDWTALPANVPHYVHTMLKGCLQKDRKARIPDIAVVRYILDGAVVPPTLAKADAVSTRRLRLWQAAAALFLLATAVGIPLVYVWRSTRPVVTRFLVLPPDKYSFATGGRSGTSVAISPDGTRLAFTARDAAAKVMLWIRPLNALVAQPVPGTDGAQFPFWSPDSRFVAYFAGGKLAKIDVTGGPPQTICTCAGRGGAWGPSGVIVLNNGQSPLFRVPAAGGSLAPLTKLANGHVGHAFPSFLPDGRHVLYFAGSASDDTAGVHVVSLDDGASKRIVGAATGAVYSPSGRVLLFVRDGTLLAQAFDVKSLTLAGDPFPIAERVEYGVFNGIVAFSVSDTGILAYGTGSGALSGLQLTWIDRTGKLIETVGGRESYRGIDLSRDGKRIAAHRHEASGGDVWITELTRGTTSRFTFDATRDNSSPVWSPDGGSIVFGAVRGGKWGLYRKASSGVGDEERLLESDVQVLPMSWAPDGQSIIYRVDANAGDQWTLPLTGDRKPVAVLASPFLESHPQVSPDGRWLAYYSNETGRTEVYVQPFGSGTGKWQVSVDGGAFPRWRGDSRELFFMNAATNGRMMAVQVRSSGAIFEADAPKPLFDSGYVNLAHTGNYHTYAVTSDGQRFLIPLPETSVTQENVSAPIAVVLNWTEGIK